MGFRSWITEKLVVQTSANTEWATSPPPIALIVDEVVSLTKQVNKYELYDQIYDQDDVVAGIVDDQAALIVTYYNGLYLDIGKDKKTSKAERKLIRRIEQLETDFDFRYFLYGQTQGALKFGDNFCQKGVEVMTVGNQIRRVPDLRTLPRSYVTLSKTHEFMATPTMWIKNPRYLLMHPFAAIDGNITDDESDESMDFRYRSDGMYPSEIIPFQLNFQVVEMDQFDYYNLNSISKSPLEPIVFDVKAKRELLKLDLMWRGENIPLKQYKLDLSAYDPVRFPGATQEDKIDAAKAKAKTDMEEFRDTIRKRASDQPLITPTTTEVVVVEPKTASYADPNESVNQIDARIASRLGGMPRARGKQGGSFAADLLLSSVTEPRLRRIAERFIRIIELYVREFLSKEDFNDELLQKLKIKRNLILPHERLDRAREVLFMSQSENTFLRRERRQALGYLPLSDEEETELEKEMESLQETMNPFQQSDKSAGDVAGDAKRKGSKIVSPKTPETKKKDTK